jgi:hypothetical protein
MSVESEAGRDDVDRDAARPQVGGQVVRVRMQGRLGRTVRAGAAAPDGGDRAEQQHAAAVGQQPPQGLRQQDGGEHVGPEVPGPQLRRGQVAAAEEDIAARAVDQHVHPSVPLGQQIADPGRLLLVGEVGGQSQGAGPEPLDGGVQHLLAAADQDDLAPVRTKASATARPIPVPPPLTTTIRDISKLQFGNGTVKRDRSLSKT